MKVQNPHDKFFKETFSNVEVARDFMQNYLPEPILKIVDLQTLDIQKDSFIDENLKEVFSDMLFQAARAMNELEEKETGIQYFETCMRYILNAGPQLSKDQLKSVLKQIELTYPEGSEVTMTLAEVFRNEGIDEGLEKGRKEGETQALTKMAVKVLTKKFGTISKEDLARMETLNTASLELIIEEFWQYETLEALKKKYF